MAELSAKQALSIVQAIDGDQHIYVWHGAVRSGKTLSSIIAWLEYVRTAPAGPLLMIGKTKDTLERNIVEPMAAWAGHGAVRYKSLANRATIFGRLVYLVGANDRKAMSRIQGITLAGSYVDEGSLLPSEEYWSMLLTRHITTPGAKIFLTSNPASPVHWLKTNVIDRADTVDARCWQFTLDDNPILEAKERARLERSVTGLFYRRFILGEWVAAEGAIYEMLDPAIHHRAARPAIDAYRLWLGIDYGTANPTHAVLLGLFDVDTDHGNLQVLSEWRHDGRDGGRLTDAALSRRLTAWLLTLDLRPEDVDPVLDPSAASFRAQLLADEWARLKAADNRVLTGIRSVATLLEPRPGRGPLLTIDTTLAPELWKELTGYVWDPKAQAAGKDEPSKVNDHGADGARYAVMAARRFWRRWVSVLEVNDPDDEAA